MKSGRTALLAILLTAACGPVSRAPVAAAPEDAVRAVLERLLAADNAGDAAAASSTYAEYAELVPPDGPRVRGRAAIRDRYERGTAAYALEVEAQVHEVRVAGDRAVIRGKTSGRIRWSDGTEPAVLDDGFAMVLGRGDSGDWEITRLLWQPRELPAPGPERGDLLLRCGRVVDGVADQPLDGADVLIADGLIVAVAPEIALPEGFTEIDLRAHTCLPGLGDLHTHITDQSEGSGDLREYLAREVVDQVEIGRANAILTLEAGFTFARDVGTYLGGADVVLRDEIEAGDAFGPRMQVAAFYLTIPGGGGDLLIPDVAEADIPPRVRRGVARGAEQFRARAEEAVAAGATVLKVIASGAVLAYGGVPGEPEMTPEEITAVVEAAHANGLKVAAHAHGARSIKDAILAGVDTVEHASYIDAEGIELARTHGVALAMDVYNGNWIDTEGRAAGWPEEFLRKNLETVDAQRDGFRAAMAAGATIVYATDSAVYPHGLNARQFAIMVGLGMTPMDAIRAATSVAARTMGWSHRVGAIEPGLFGDVIAVRGDPLIDIAVLENVDTVIKGGVVVTSGQGR